MIGGFGSEILLTHSQTLNGYDAFGYLIDPGPRMDSSKWATSGKQDWRCGMNQTSG